MTPFTNIPKHVEEALENWGGTTSRRSFLKKSGLLVVTVSAAVVTGGSALEAIAAQAGRSYPDPDFRQLVRFD